MPHSALTNQRELCMNHELFSAALGLSAPWFVEGLDFDECGRLLTVPSTFAAVPAS